MTYQDTITSCVTKWSLMAWKNMCFSSLAFLPLGFTALDFHIAASCGDLDRWNFNHNCTWIGDSWSGADDFFEDNQRIRVMVCDHARTWHNACASHARLGDEDGYGGQQETWRCVWIHDVDIIINFYLCNDVRIETDRSKNCKGNVYYNISVFNVFGIVVYF